MTLEERVNRVVDFAKHVIDKGDDFMATLHVFGKDGVETVAVVHELMDPKYRPVKRKVMQDLLKTCDAESYIFVAEAWTVRLENVKPEDARNIVASQDDRRRSVLTVSAGNLEGMEVFAVYGIKEKGKREMVREPEAWMTSDDKNAVMTGEMVGLLKGI